MKRDEPFIPVNLALKDDLVTRLGQRATWH